MIKATVEITCDVCGKEHLPVAASELIILPALLPAWTGWKIVELARRDNWMIDVEKNTAFCENHGPEDLTKEIE